MMTFAGEPPSLQSALQIADAYSDLASIGYRPMAPSDGFGNIEPGYDLESQRRLANEVERFIEWWWNQETAGVFRIGCANFTERPAMILAVEAARLCCSGDRELARRALKVALAALDEDNT